MFVKISIIQDVGGNFYELMVEILAAQNLQIKCNTGIAFKEKHHNPGDYAVKTIAFNLTSVAFTLTEHDFWLKS